MQKKLINSDNPEETRAKKIKEYREKFANPYVAASKGMVDDVIDPRETRIKIIQGLEILKNKQESRPKKNMEIFLFNEDERKSVKFNLQISFISLFHSICPNLKALNKRSILGKKM